MIKDLGMIVVLTMVLLVGGFYYSSTRHNQGPIVEPISGITSFEECAAAGYPIMESYPEQCRTPDGQLFVREIDEPVFCTADAMMCPDGSYVGRTGPNCTFVCPN